MSEPIKPMVRRMKPRLLTVLLIAVLAGLTACQSPRGATPSAQDVSSTPPSKQVNLAVRNNAFALLMDLLNDERHLSKILLIKFESPEVDRLVTEISRTADEAAKSLEAMAKADPQLAQVKLDLPPGEAATREAIARTRKDQLLNSKGKEFEFALLLTQVQALNYGAHLASVIASNEPQPDRAQHFSSLSAQFNRLYDDVTALLRTK